MTREPTRQEFLGFVEEHTEALFQVAYSLTGEQSAAERLLQATLERLLLRWRRESDPYAYAVRAMAHLRLPWWRRWLPIRGDDATTPVTEGAGRPVNVGEFALTGARRLRLVRVGAAVACGLVLLAAAVVAPRPGSDREPVPPLDPSTLDGKSVVTSYRDGGRYLLNPETGEYEFTLSEGASGVFSPDLRDTARLTPAGSGSSLAIYSVVDGADRLSVELRGLATTVAWSPDGRWLAVTGRPAHLASGFGSVMIVDARSGEVEELTLEFPAGRGGFGTSIGAFWVDADQLAVPTADLSRWIPDRLGPLDASRPVVAVSIFDLTGQLVEELPVDTGELDASDDPHAGMVWIPVGAVRGDRFLLIRRPGPDQVEIAAPALATDPGPYETVTFSVPGAPEREFLPAWPHAWLTDGRVLVRPNLPVEQPIQQLVAVDLDTGAVQPVDMAAELATRLPIPAGATNLTFGDALPLAPAAYHLAF